MQKDTFSLQNKHIESYPINSHSRFVVMSVVLVLVLALGCAVILEAVLPNIDTWSLLRTRSRIHSTEKPQKNTLGDSFKSLNAPITEPRNHSPGIRPSGFWNFNSEELRIITSLPHGLLIKDGSLNDGMRLSDQRTFDTFMQEREPRYCVQVEAELLATLQNMLQSWNKNECPRILKTWADSGVSMDGGR